MEFKLATTLAELEDKLRAIGIRCHIAFPESRASETPELCDDCGFVEKIEASP